MALLSHDRVYAKNKFVCLFFVKTYNVYKFICIVSSLVHKSLKNEGTEIITLDTALQKLAFCDLV